MRLNWTFWDILRQFGRRFEEFGAIRPFSYSFPTIISHNRLIEKKRVMYGPTTDGWTEPLIEMRGRIYKAS